MDCEPGEFRLQAATCMGNDFYPYHLRNGDQWSKDQPYRFGSTTSPVELPVTWSLDDFPAFEFVIGAMQGYNSSSAVREAWQGDFDYAVANCPGGFFNLTLHPQVIARGARITMLEGLLRHMAEHPHVAFKTLGAVASRWKAANPLERWKAANPVRTGVNSIGSL